MIRANTIRVIAFSALLPLSLVAPPAASAQEGGAYAGLVAKHAAAHGLPAALVHRVIMRESRYNPRAVSKGNYGMMQIRLGTARAMGYRGDAAGLLDPEVNMTYAVKYLAGAFRAAGGNHDRAVAFYARGYYDVAKRQGFSPYALASEPAIAAPDISARARAAHNSAWPVRPARAAAAPALAVTTSRDHEVR